MASRCLPLVLSLALPLLVLPLVFFWRTSIVTILLADLNSEESAWPPVVSRGLPLVLPLVLPLLVLPLVFL